MYTDKAYLVKDRNREKVPPGSIRTIYRLSTTTQGAISHYDPELYPSARIGSLSTTSVIPECPPGLEILASISKVYLIKRLEMIENEVMGTYKAELINEAGDRIFVVTNSNHYSSDEVIQYGKYSKLKMRGKVCFGVINYAGAQVFEIYGDPGKVIRVGPNSAVWGEIQVVPGPLLTRCPLHHLCCFCKSQKQKMQDDEAEIRVVILKKDLGGKDGPFNLHQPCFKHIYTLRGQVQGGVCQHNDNIMYKKTFDLQIYSSDPLMYHADSPEAAKAVVEAKATKRLLYDKNIEIKPIGRLASNERHEVLGCSLPILEMPEELNVYDKITLIGTFFLFSLL